MIGDNIRSIRHSHDMTQPEFAAIVGISRNSLSRYENGTSSVSTELIDCICQNFNLSYIDVIGKEKLLSPAEDYQLTVQVELIKERGATILSQLYDYQDMQQIDFDDVTNPWILMSNQVEDIINTKIYLVGSFKEIERFNGFLNGVLNMLETAKNGRLINEN